MAQHYSGNAIKTTIVGGISNVDSALTLTSATGWPTAPFVATLERESVREEQILIGVRAGTSCSSITRGYGGTTALAHPVGAVIEHTADAVSMQRWEDHLTNTSAPHTASAISNTPSGNIASVTVQGALNELDTEKALITEPIAVAHAGVASGAHAATAISFSPTGTVAATTVQAAIAEVATEYTAAIAGLDATYATDAALALAGVPTGAILDFGGPAANTPVGYLPCDGTVRVRTAFPALFAAIGTSWNTGGEAGTDFRLPNVAGRVTVGAGAGAGLTARTIGQMFGTETHALALAELASHTHVQDAHTHIQNAHNHTATDSGHSHGTGQAIYGGGLVAFAGGSQSVISDTTTGYAAITVVNQTAVNQNFTAVNQPNGSGTAHNNVQPSAVVTKIIKT